MRSALVGMLTALLTLVGGVGVARASVYDIRGEWSFETVCQGCTFPKVDEKAATSAVTFRKEEANGDFTGTAQLGGASGTVVGTITGTQMSAVITVPLPEGSFKFNIVGATIDEATNTITGEGPWQFGSESGNATFTGRRIRSLGQIEKEEKERSEKEQREREQQEKELKEKQEVKEKEEAVQHAKEAEEAKAKEVIEKEAQAKQREKEQQEKEALEQKARTEKAAQESTERKAKEEEAQRIAAALVPATLVEKTTLTAGASGSLSLSLSNPNDYTISGEITVTAGSAGKASHGSAKGTAAVLASASYTAPPHGSQEAVKLKLSKSALATLKSHKVLHATVQITTDATGKTSVTKTYSITLKAPKRHH
jgi:flagellar biosynthesis GTPase FlhF